MRVLITMLHPGYLRNYESVIAELDRRGHHVTVYFSQVEKQRIDSPARRLRRELPHVEFGPRLLHRGKDRWTKVLDLLRTSVDLSRFADGQYGESSQLRARMLGKFEKVAPGDTTRWANLLLSLRNKSVRLRVQRALIRLDEAVPRDERLLSQLRAETPDVVLVTPLVNAASRQTDVVRHSQSLGIPVGVLIASWDNLTNKGLLRCRPDRVFVWNEDQRGEAVGQHDVPFDSVRVTGAQLFDQWFERKPSRSREEFFRKLGLDPAQPMLVWLGSSSFIGGSQEPALVEQWLTVMRSSGPLSEVGLLVRPHPQNVMAWSSVDLSRLGNVAIYPRHGSIPIDDASRDDFFHSIHYSEAAIGINSSAMIEAVIFGRPVFSVSAPEFAAAQKGTPHFSHLERAFLNLAPNLDALKSMMESVLLDPGPFMTRNEAFLTSFLRPAGVNQPATPILADEIELLASRASTQPLRSRFGDPARLAVLTLLAARVDRSRRRQQGDVNEPTEAKSPRPHRLRHDVRQLARPLSHGDRSRVARRLSRQMALRLARIDVVRNYVMVPLVRAVAPAGTPTGKHERVPSVPSMPSAIKDLGKQTGALSRYLPRIQVADQEAARALGRLRKSDLPIIAGPWTSELGFELLYWIPFLRWAANKYQLPRERLISVTRGGAGSFYDDIAGSSVDILDLMSAEDYRERTETRWRQVGGQKQVNAGDSLDRSIAQLAAQSMGIEKYDSIHPALMYRLFATYWKGQMAPGQLRQRTMYSPLAQPAISEVLDRRLPESYVAVRFYFRPSFPDTPNNRDFIQGLLRQLSETGPIVMLNSGFRLDEHDDFSCAGSDRVVYVDDLMTPATNLAVQAAVVSRAESFFGTYGGLAYLAPFYKVPSYSFYSHPARLLHPHATLAESVARQFGVPFAALDTFSAFRLRQGLQERVDRPPEIQIADGPRYE